MDRRVATAVRCAVVLAVAGCGGRAVTLPDPADVPAPTFVEVPADLAQSQQLAAMPEREVGGLPPAAPSASADALPEALAQLAALPEPPQTLTDVSIYADSIHFRFPDPAIEGRTITAVHRPGEQMYLAEPQFDDAQSYPSSAVDPTVPARLVAAVETRFPHLAVSDLDLSVSLSHEFGLVWYVTVQDARGRLAVVYADLDGAIVAVDEW